jgi:hypothetical protein
MGQNLMSWTTSAGLQFEEDGPEARDRGHRDALHEGRGSGIGRRHPSSLTAIAGFLGIATLGRSRPVAAPITHCCAFA